MRDEIVPDGRDAPTDKRILVRLRSMILDGEIEAGSKLSEVAVAKDFGVSRTPARMALAALEIEGMIRKREGRGYTVEEVNFGEVKDAYVVRGVLEGLAAGTLAKRGMTPEIRAKLKHAILSMEDALDSDMPLADRVTVYQQHNAIFHQTIMSECGNAFVKFAFDRMGQLPLLMPGTVVFAEESAEKDMQRIRLGNMQHRLIFDAISKNDPQRAEAMMREHANQTLVYSALFSVDFEED